MAIGTAPHGGSQAPESSLSFRWDPYHNLIGDLPLRGDS